MIDFWKKTSEAGISREPIKEKPGKIVFLIYIERRIDWYMYEMIIPINIFCQVLWKNEL